jgi:hypothetical protein
VYLTSWFEEMEKEAAINEEVDKKMTELLDLAGGVMSGPNKVGYSQFSRKIQCIYWQTHIILAC